MRLINYLLALPKKLKHKLHLIPDKNCQICEARDNKWDPTVIEQNAEKSLFRYETRVIKDSMKPDQVQEFEEVDGVFIILSWKNRSGESIENSRSGRI